MIWTARAQIFDGNHHIAFILKLIPSSMNLTRNQKILFAQNVYRSFLTENTLNKDEYAMKKTTKAASNMIDIELGSNRNKESPKLPLVKSLNFMRF